MDENYPAFSCEVENYHLDLQSIPMENASKISKIII